MTPKRRYSYFFFLFFFFLGLGWSSALGTAAGGRGVVAGSGRASAAVRGPAEGVGREFEGGEGLRC